MTIYFALLSAIIIAATSGWVFGTMAPAVAPLRWNWSYSGNGINASGTLMTNDTPDSMGYYQITDITGTRNGEKIIALQPAETSILGNQPFKVDNLINPSSPQLTNHGFGYHTSGGNYVNNFWADFLTPQVYLEYFSSPPFISGTIGPEDSEQFVSFSATIVPNTREEATDNRQQ